MNPPSIPFVVGQPFTVIGISEMMANTTKDEIIVASLLPAPEFKPRYAGASTGSWRFGTAKLKGKRKEFYLDVKPGTLVFAGHGVTTIDSDEHVVLSHPATSRMVIRGFSGNACYNFCGTPEEIRALITEKNLNPDFKDHGSVLVIPPADSGRTWYDKDKEDLAFPDVHTSHAVVQRIRDKRAAETPEPEAERSAPAETPTAPAAKPLSYALPPFLTGAN